MYRELRQGGASQKDAAYKVQRRFGRSERWAMGTVNVTFEKLLAEADTRLNKRRRWW